LLGACPARPQLCRAECAPLRFLRRVTFPKEAGAFQPRHKAIWRAGLQHLNKAFLSFATYVLRKISALICIQKNSVKAIDRPASISEAMAIQSRGFWSLLRK
jgi:hypothetical protein